MMTKQLIDRIEGEASIYFELTEGRVDFATIAFPHFRGMEKICLGREALDALVITPRVCGICGHAHLMAAVRALESAYASAGFPVRLSRKAETIRELTLVLEMIQNHFKWLYLVIIPELSRLTEMPKPLTPLKGAFAASLATKALALFAGQWPHSSYMLPGGITSDPTHLERIRAEGFVDELIRFFEAECAGIGLETMLGFDSCREFNGVQSDMTGVEAALIRTGMHELGGAHDRFAVLGSHGFTTPSRVMQTRLMRIHPKHLTLEVARCDAERSYAKNVLYKGEFYEGGPLARAMASSVPLIKNMHRRFKDSAYTRAMARLYEIPLLLDHAKSLLAALDLSEASYNAPVPVGRISGEGVGIVEAPRGPLIHRVRLERGKISAYEMITPTQWNLGSGGRNNPAPAQRAMMGAPSIPQASFIFRTFDVCSVCTTH